MSDSKPPKASSVASKVQIVQIDEDRAGQRIDNFLISRLKGVPKSRIYRLLRKGEVRVNKGRIKASYRLQAGDDVRIPPVRQGEPGKSSAPGQRVLSLIKGSILMEEKGFLVLNKPSGIAVHGGSGLNYGVIEAMRALRPDAPYLELVHRLDRETSGALIIAKKRSVLREFHAMLRGEGGPGQSGRMEKRYLALVKGKWQGKFRRVDAPLLKNTLKSGERMVQVSEEGKSALSLFKPVTVYGNASLVEVGLLTGRTHQIRVHAQSICFPVAGDEKYGDESFNKTMKAMGLNRLFLHAESVSFQLSDSDKKYRIKAPLSTELQKVLDRLES